jgi:hypothetical protein
MGKKKKDKDPERTREFPLMLFRIQAEDAQRARSKKLRRAEPPEDYKRERALRFVRNEDERIAQTQIGLITKQIYERMDLESKMGRRHAIVYSFGASEFKPKGGLISSERHDSTICSDDWLIGTARGVFLYCEKKGLKPTVELWRSGPESPARYGFNIVVHF